MIPLETIDRVMRSALRKVLADLDTVDDRIEMEFIIGQFYGEVETLLDLTHKPNPC